MARAYEAIDLCIVASRDEGGPRAVLESMAIGVPLVTTRVGQAADLVRHEENGWMVEVEDVDGLVAWGHHVAEAPRATLEPSSRPAAGPPRRTRTTRCGRGGGRCSKGLVTRPRRGRRLSGPDPGRRAARYGRAGARWARLLVPRPRPHPGVRVFYGHDSVPAPGERAAGGTVKMQKLNARFPNSPTDFSILYLGTTWLPRDLRPTARAREAPTGAGRREPGRRRVPGLGG